MKLFLCATALSSVFAIGAATITWNGAGDGTTWDMDGNWQGGVAPGEEDTARIESYAGDIVISSPTNVAALTAATTGSSHIHLFVQSDFTVAGEAKFATQNGAKATINQSAGKTTVGSKLTLGGTNSNTVEWDMHGASASLETPVLFAVQYRGAGSCGFVARDGATLTVTSKVDLGHEGGNANTPPGLGYLKVLDGASATVKDLVFVSSGYGQVDVSNATLTVTGTILGNGSADPVHGLDYSTVNVWKDGKVVASTIAFSQYTASHEQMVQWPGSDVQVATLKLAGYGQGGTGSATDCRYIVNGGTLTITGSPVVGSNGQGEMHLNGGTSTISGSNIRVDNVKDTSTTQYEPSKLRLAGDAILSASNAKLWMNRVDDWTIRGGRVALELEGGMFDATVKGLEWATVASDPHQSIIAIVDETGLAGLKVKENVTFGSPLVVEPSALEGAPYGTYTILSWEGTATGLENVSLSPDASPQWKLYVLEAQKCIRLRHSPKRFMVVVR